MAYRKGYDARIWRGKKKKKPSNKEVDGGNTHDVRDESGGAEGCGGESGLVEKKLTMAIAGALRVM